MNATNITWPKKTREFENSQCDSRAWNGFAFRDGDIIVATLGKSGTSLMQQIVGQLVFEGKDGLFGGPSVQISPWLDARWTTPDVVAALEAQTHRRFIKTHLPVDALVFSPKAKYIYVGRDMRDVIWSLHNFILGFTPQVREIERTWAPTQHARTLPPADIHAFYMTEVGKEEPSWSHVKGWWNARDLPNVLLVHFNNMKADLAGEMRRVARFLGIPIKEELMPQMLDHCGLEYMRSKAEEDLKSIFNGGSSTFFHKGTNGRWKEVLSPAEIALADEAAAKYLTPACAHWLKTGELPD
jgi:aryl sulfotransferase